MIYIGLFFILFINSMFFFSNNKILKKYAYISSYMYIYIFATIRWENWTDWEQYYNYFLKGVKTFSHYYDKGYILLNYLIYNIIPSYTFFLAIYNLIIICSIYYFVKTYIEEEYRLLTIIPMYIFILYSGGNRQFIAISIMLIAISNLEKNKYFKFYICLIFAFLFHKTSLVTISFLFMNKKIKKKYRSLLLGIFIAFSLSQIMDYFVNDNFIESILKISFFQKQYFIERIRYFQYMGYLEEDKKIIYQLISILKQILPIIILTFIILKNKVILQKKEEKLYSYFLYGSLIFIIFSSPNFIAFKRFYLYFKVFELTTISLCIKYSKSKYLTYLFFVLLNLLNLLYIIYYTYPDEYIPYRIFLS
ncbi:EpsG family protein [Defluviitalea phaphyphila]|uniref:EpsG family protein n=1 Tax=Defluviitalea phaphyphila TaxID=1473580 RepID=UPI0007319E77|nr:EpsG family protein [Defluviitalea phaphyphila]